METEKKTSGKRKAVWLLIFSAAIGSAYYLLQKNSLPGLGFLWSKIGSRIENKNGAVLIKTDTITILKHDTNWYAMPAQKIRVVDSVRMIVPANIDTLAVLRSYFTKFIYRDTLRDSNLVITLMVEVSGNKVTGDSLRYKLLRPDREKIITNTYEAAPRPTFLLGAALGGNAREFSFSPGFLWQDKKKRAYGYAFDLINRRHNVSFYLPLFSRRKM